LKYNLKNLRRFFLKLLLRQLVYLKQIFLVTFYKILKKSLLCLFLFNLLIIIYAFYLLNWNFSRIQRCCWILLIVANFCFGLFHFLCWYELFLGVHRLIIFDFWLNGWNIIFNSVLPCLKRFLSGLFRKS